MRGPISANGKRTGARARAPFVLLLAALAFLWQGFLAPVHTRTAPFGADGSRAVASELKALFGESAFVCVQAGDETPSPTHEKSCDDTCPLCQIQATGLAFWPHDDLVGAVRLDGAVSAIGPPVSPAPRRLQRVAQAQPRAPPLEA